MLMHENTHYRVTFMEGSEVVHSNNTYRNSYHVINKKTGSTEFRTPALPEALYISEDLNAAMEAEAWNWRKAEEKAMAEALAPVKVTPDVFN